MSPPPSAGKKDKKALRKSAKFNVLRIIPKHFEAFWSEFRAQNAVEDPKKDKKKDQLAAGTPSARTRKPWV